VTCVQKDLGGQRVERLPGKPRQIIAREVGEALWGLRGAIQKRSRGVVLGHPGREGVKEPLLMPFIVHTSEEGV